MNSEGRRGGKRGGRSNFGTPLHSSVVKAALSFNAAHPASPTSAGASPCPCPCPVAVCCAGQRGRRQPPAASRQAGSITRPSPNTQRPHAPWAVAHSSTQTSLHYGDGGSSKDRTLFQVVPVSRSAVPRATEERVPATALHQLFIARARNRARFTTLLLSTVTLQVLLRFCSLTVLGANEAFWLLRYKFSQLAHRARCFCEWKNCIYLFAFNKSLKSYFCR